VVAEHTSISEYTLMDWSRHRGLPCIRPSSRVVLFNLDEVDAWLRKSNLESAAAEAV